METIKSRKLEVFGHVTRINDNRLLKMATGRIVQVADQEEDRHRLVSAGPVCDDDNGYGRKHMEAVHD